MKLSANNEDNAGTLKIKRLERQVEKASTLLAEVLQTAFQPSAQPKTKDAEKAFISRHAWNIHARAQDIILLSRARHSGSLPILNRVSLESLFYMAAAAKSPEYAFQKILHEIDEYGKRYKHLGKDNDWIDQAVQHELGVFEKHVRETAYHTFNREIASRNCCALDAAQEAGMENIYRMHYWGNSNHVHANGFGLPTEEGRPPDEIADDLSLCIFVLIKTSGVINERFCQGGDFKRRIDEINHGI